MELYSSREAATMLGCSQQLIRYLAAKLKIGHNIGGSWVFSKRQIEQLRAWREEHGRKPVPSD